MAINVSVGNATAILVTARTARLNEAIDRVLALLRHQIKARSLNPLETTLERAMARAFRAQKRLFLDRFRKIEEQPLERLDEADWGWMLTAAITDTYDLFSEPAQSAVEVSLLAGAADAETALGPTPVTEAEGQLGLGISFSLDDPRAVAFLHNYGAVLVSKISKTTKARVRALVTKGIDGGWSYTKLERELIKLYDGFAVGKPQQHIRSRAALIAITELGQAYEFGNYIVVNMLDERGVLMEKTWSTMGDDRVSDDCLANEADGAGGWLPLTQPHSSGHLHPLRFPGCRCDELYRRKKGRT